MILPNDPKIETWFHELWNKIKACGAEQWAREKGVGPDLEGLIYLCRFAFFTGIISKGDVANILELDKKERKQLVKSWYDLHRSKGCGTC